MNNHGLSTTGLRRAVKEIAVEVEYLQYHNRNGRCEEKTITAMSQVQDRLAVQNEKLAALCERDLSRARPAPTIMRSVRSGALLMAAAGTRVAALAAAAGTAVVEASVVAVMSPITGCLGSSIKGCMKGSRYPVGIAKPLTATGCMGVGAVRGTVSGTIGMVTRPPKRVVKPYSTTQCMFRLVDQYSKASAHVKRKKMSTEEIALKTKERIETTYWGVGASIDTQRAKWSRILTGRNGPFGGISVNDEGGITSTW